MFCEIRSENACAEWLLYSDWLCMLPTTSERTPVLVYVLLYIGRFYQTSWPIQLVSTVTKVYKHGLKVSSHLHLSNQKAWWSLKYGSDAKSLMPSFLWVKRIEPEALLAHRMRHKKTWHSEEDENSSFKILHPDGLWNYLVFCLMTYSECHIPEFILKDDMVFLLKEKKYG